MYEYELIFSFANRKDKRKRIFYSYEIMQDYIKRYNLFVIEINKRELL